MKEKARVAVLGLGDFGYHFACSLHQLGHEVLAIDSDQDKVQQILPDVTKAAVANVLDRPAMEELGVSGFDIVVVCLPERLETTVLLVHHLKQIQTLQIIVKVANAEQAAIVKLVGATEIIQPDLSTARKCAMLIHHPRAIDYLEMGSGNMVTASVPPSSLIGKTPRDVHLTEDYGVSLLSVWHPDQEGPPMPPDPDRPIAETDILIIGGHIDRLRELKKMK